MQVPTESGILTRLPSTTREDGVGTGVTEVLEAVLVRHGQLERIHVVLEADDFHITHGALGGFGLVAKDRRHGVGGGAQAQIPDDDGGGGLGGLACR